MAGEILLKEEQHERIDHLLVKAAAILVLVRNSGDHGECETVRANALWAAEGLIADAHNLIGHY